MRDMFSSVQVGINDFQTFTKGALYRSNVTLEEPLNAYRASASSNNLVVDLVAPCNCDLRLGVELTLLISSLIFSGVAKNLE